MTDFNLAHAVHGTIRRLHHIQRYSSIPCIKPQNVAAHSWEAAFIGWLIAADLTEAGIKVRTDMVVQRAIMHDISEAMSGDVIRSYKYRTHKMRVACKEADVQNTYELSRQLGGDVGDQAYLLWVDAKEDTLEGDIVKLADMVCVVTYCAEEWHLGNRRLDWVLQRTYQEIAVPMAEHSVLGKYIEQLFPTGDYTDAYNFDGSWITTWKDPAT